MDPINYDARPVTVQALTCPCCGDTIYSRARHDMRGCGCGGVMIDGGFEYVKVSWRTECAPGKTRPLTVMASRRELYDDWNHGRNQFGCIPATRPDGTD